MTDAMLDQIEKATALKATTLSKRRREAEGKPITTFAVGDYVLQRRDSPFGAPGLEPRYLGPFIVRSVVKASDSYMIQDVRQHKGPHKVHVSDLIRFNARRSDDPTVLATMDDERWVIEEVLNHRTGPNENGKRTTDLHIRWKGVEEPSWNHIGRITPSNCTALFNYVQENKLSWTGGCVEGQRTSRKKTGKA